LRGERGQALVEFVLILPVFLLLVFGMVEFGKAFNYWIDMTHLANEGARYAAVNRWPGCAAGDAGVCPAPNDTLIKYIKGRANSAELRDAKTTPYIVAPNDKLCVAIAFPPPGSGLTAGAVGTPVRVTVKAGYTLPVVNGLLGAIPGLSEIAKIHLAASSTMRLERTPTRYGVASCP
jgi:hypothetical protein